MAKTKTDDQKSIMATTHSKLIDGSFPPELLLEIVEHLPFGDGSTISNLANTHTRIRTILSSYEKSLVRNFVRTEVRHAGVDFPTRMRTFRWLKSCIRRYDVVDDLMAMLTSEHNVLPVPKHNMALVNTGLLLLYHMQTFGKQALLSPSALYL